MRLELPTGPIELAHGAPVIMGILNVGLDSVADDRVTAGVGERVARGVQLVADGARIVDVGAISGRTDTAALPEQEESALLVPVVRELARAGVTVSVDTWRPNVVAAVLDAGAAIINDVSGLADPAVARLAAQAGAGLVVMHTGAPPKQRAFFADDDPTGTVVAFLSAQVERARAAGVRDPQMIIDPGLDYTKTPAQTVEVLRNLDRLGELSLPVLLAVSRKYFVGMLTGRPPMERLAGTLAAVHAGVARGAAIVRVHDVREVSDFLRVHRTLATGSPVTWVGDDGDEGLMWMPPKSARSPRPS